MSFSPDLQPPTRAAPPTPSRRPPSQTQLLSYLYSSALSGTSPRSQRSHRSFADESLLSDSVEYDLIVERKSLQDELRYEHEARSDADSERLRVVQRLKLEQLARQDLEGLYDVLLRERNGLERRTRDLEVVNSGLITELEIAKETTTQLEVRERMMLERLRMSDAEHVSASVEMKEKVKAFEISAREDRRMAEEKSKKLDSVLVQLEIQEAECQRLKGALQNLEMENTRLRSEADTARVSRDSAVQELHMATLEHSRVVGQWQDRYRQDITDAVTTTTNQLRTELQAALSRLDGAKLQHDETTSAATVQKDEQIALLQKELSSVKQQLRDIQAESADHDPRALVAEIDLLRSSLQQSELRLLEHQEEHASQLRLKSIELSQANSTIADLQRRLVVAMQRTNTPSPSEHSSPSRSTVVPQSGVTFSPPKTSPLAPGSFSSPVISPVSQLSASRESRRDDDPRLPLDPTVSVNYERSSAEEPTDVEPAPIGSTDVVESETNDLEQRAHDEVMSEVPPLRQAPVPPSNPPPIRRPGSVSQPADVLTHPQAEPSSDIAEEELTQASSDSVPVELGRERRSMTVSNRYISEDPAPRPPSLSRKPRSYTAVVEANYKLPIDLASINQQQRSQRDASPGRRDMSPALSRARDFESRSPSPRSRAGVPSNFPYTTVRAASPVMAARRAPAPPDDDDWETDAPEPPVPRNIIQTFAQRESAKLAVDKSSLREHAEDTNEMPPPRRRAPTLESPGVGRVPAFAPPPSLRPSAGDDWSDDDETANITTSAATVPVKRGGPPAPELSPILVIASKPRQIDAQRKENALQLKTEVEARQKEFLATSLRSPSRLPDDKPDPPMHTPSPVKTPRFMNPTIARPVTPRYTGSSTPSPTSSTPVTPSGQEPHSRSSPHSKAKTPRRYEPKSYTIRGPLFTDAVVLAEMNDNLRRRLETATAYIAQLEGDAMIRGEHASPRISVGLQERGIQTDVIPCSLSYRISEEEVRMMQVEIATLKEENCQLNSCVKKSDSQVRDLKDCLSAREYDLSRIRILLALTEDELHQSRTLLTHTELTLEEGIADARNRLSEMLLAYTELEQSSGRTDELCLSVFSDLESQNTSRNAEDEC